ncbi:hypothetical protein GT347_15720 [Xylophilus rhododendri]|uniref:F-box domain-containing protein n=1 Tax=Xylophilus rhododendri TaxID=2697032 RepID=A0A857J957_9BURK|nr:F-box protein [Xylophilus rhododendri]QHI99295.1 hypothetical protein GT347_15720 [Xylophilus rhododendri]
MTLPPANLGAASGRHKPGGPASVHADADGTEDAGVGSSEPSLLETLPVELQQRTFAFLSAPDLQALAHTSKALNAIVGADLARARAAVRLASAADLPAALAAVLPQIHFIAHPALARRALLSATLAVLRLPLPQQEPWLTRLAGIAAGKALGRKAQAELLRFIAAATSLGQRPVEAERGFAALDTLLGADFLLPQVEQQRLYLVLAEAFWSGVLGEQALGSELAPTVLSMFLHLLWQLKSWPQERQMPVLRVLLLGVRSVNPLSMEIAHFHALAHIVRFDPPLRAIALACLRQGVQRPVPCTNWYVESLQSRLALHTPQERDAAEACMQEQLQDLHARYG